MCTIKSLLWVVSIILLVTSCSLSDPESHYNAAVEMGLSGENEKAVKMFRKIMKHSEGEAVYYKAQYGIARNYYYMNEFSKAKDTAENLLENIPKDFNPRFIWSTKLILLSVERETPKKNGVYDLNLITNKAIK